MTNGFQANGFAVDARWWARAAHVLVGVVVGAFERMVFGKVVASAERADDSIFVSSASVDFVAKAVAAVTLVDQRKGSEEFYDARGTVEEKRISSETSEA